MLAQKVKEALLLLCFQLVTHFFFFQTSWWDTIWCRVILFCDTDTVRLIEQFGITFEHIAFSINMCDSDSDTSEGTGSRKRQKVRRKAVNGRFYAKKRF